MFALALPLGAQQVRLATGVLQRADAGKTQPVAGAWVVLHRVARDKSGPLDSVRSDAWGRFAFRYTPVGTSAVYFASAMYAGVAYFTSPFTSDSASRTGAELTVFDTTSVGLRVATRSRHIIVYAADSAGLCRISEVFWLENTGTRTRVPAGRDASWQSLLPAGAVGVHVDDGDVAEQAVKVRDNRLEVFAPFPPGLRTLQVSYQVAAAHFPLTVPVPDSLAALEVLAERPEVRAIGATLAPQAAVSVSERQFQRFLAHDVAAGATFVISATGGASATRGVYVAVLVALAALTLLIGMARLMATPVAMRLPGRAVPKRAEALARAIADLDERFGRTRTPTDGERAAYVAARESLKAELNAVLAERDDQL
jgi:hypothetical protein